MSARQFLTFKIFIFFNSIFVGDVGFSNIRLQNLQSELLQQAEYLLNNSEVSYVYGGSKLGTPEDCNLCNKCLEEKDPDPKKRLSRCPQCSKCSLDCSHFIQLVFQRSGVAMPYLNTEMMLQSSTEDLRKKYKLVDLGNHLSDLRPGDMLVYKGHVVLLEYLHESNVGDIVHATGGKDIRLPGQGIQRERFVPLHNFRGPLLRILRHESLHGQRVFYHGK